MTKRPLLNIYGMRIAHLRRLLAGTYNLVWTSSVTFWDQTRFRFEPDFHKTVYLDVRDSGSM